MPNPPSVIPVRIDLTQSSHEFLEALARLLNAIDDADRALLETTVATAAERVREALTSADAIAIRRVDESGFDVEDELDDCDCGACQFRRAVMSGTPMVVAAVKLERIRQLARAVALAAAAMILLRPWRR